MKTCILFGTRPEIIKMSPLIREGKRRDEDFFVLHTGQHATYEMDEVFFKDLNLPPPEYKLDTVAKTLSRTPATLLSLMMVGIEEILKEIRPDVVLVPSDPHSTLAGAYVAAQMQIKVGHVESGLRSYDWSMPEEHNRVMTDHISTYLFAPTEFAASILRKENIPDSRIFVTGNTVVDAVHQHLDLAKKKSNIVKDLNLEEKKYFLLTLHRAENLNSPERLANILKGFEKIGKEFEEKILFPIHPSTVKALKKYQLSLPKNVRTIEPVGYLDFLLLESQAKLILTDSGGIQEETAVLKVPCVTLRYNTERPESVEAGSNIIAGTEPDRILSCTQEMLARERNWKNPFGDGQAAQRIWKIITAS